MIWSLGLAVFVLAFVVALVLALVLGLRPMIRPRRRREQLRPLGMAGVLARLLGANAKPTRVERLPNGWAYYYDIPEGWRRELARRYVVALERIAGKVVPFVVRKVEGAAVGDNGLPLRTQLVVFQLSLSPASVATIVCAEQALTVTGIRSDDVCVFAGPSGAPGNSVGSTYGRVSAANTLSQNFCNPTAGALVPTAGVYNVVVLRG